MRGDLSNIAFVSGTVTSNLDPWRSLSRINNTHLVKLISIINLRVMLSSACLFLVFFNSEQRFGQLGH